MRIEEAVELLPAEGGPDLVARVDDATKGLSGHVGRDERGVQTVPSTQTMPDMMGAVFASQGRRVADVRRWLGSSDLTPRFTPREGHAPDRVTWLDANGQTVQVWIDSNNDGQADIVELYQKGKLVTRYRQ